MEKKLKEKFIVIVYGPTGVGKSGFAEKLASMLPSQIVNCDIGQFYRPFSIGTAKPDWKSSPATQHLFDIIDTPKHFNVCEYRKLLFDTVEKIWADNELPILVGGSGFYLKSLFFPPVFNPQMIVDAKKFDELENLCETHLWEYLNKIDPKRAEQIDENDTYRVRRALDLWVQTGKKPSELSPVYNFPCNFFLVFLDRDRKNMYSHIETRTHQMIQEGWIQEVEQLLGTQWETFLRKKKLIGYDIIMDYLKTQQTQKDLDRMIDIIQKKTKNYAKRQVTFWKSFRRELQDNLNKMEFQDFQVSSRIDTINLSLIDLDLYMKQLLDYLKPLFE